MLKRCLFVAAIVVVSSVVYGQAPLPKKVLTAKTVFFVNDGTNAKRFDEAYDTLRASGRFTMVDSRESAELVMTISVAAQKELGLGTWGFPPFVLKITDSASQLLWSDTGGAPKKLVEELLKRITTAEKPR